MKTKSLLMLTVLAILATVGFTGCDELAVEDNPMQAYLTMRTSDVTLKVGETYVRKAVAAGTAVVVYSSSDATVATVDQQGKVTAINPGTVKITAQTTGLNAEGKKIYLAEEKSYKVTVKPAFIPYAANDYNEAVWDGTKVIFTKQTFASVTPVTDATANVTWDDGYYTVSGNVTITGNVTLGAETHLILQDGAKLTINGKIDGGLSKYNLSIYGQASQTGQLVVNRTNGDAILNITTLKVHSCQVTATSSYSGYAGFYNIGTFNVYGGSIDAEYTGSSHGYGIWLANNGSMNIYGGDVKAVGKGSHYGITGSSSTVTVYGGKLWAENAGNKALDSNVTLAKDAGFTGKIETSDNGESWTDWTTTGTPSTKYVRVGY